MKREFSVGSEQWGAPRTRHYASVLFRSWQADPTPTAGTGTSTQPAPRGAGSWLSKTARHVPELPGTTPSDAPPGEGDDGDAGSGEAKGAAALADTNEYAPTFAPCFESGITGNRGADGAKYGSLCRDCQRCTQHPSHPNDVQVPRRVLLFAPTPLALHVGNRGGQRSEPAGPPRRACRP